MAANGAGSGAGKLLIRYGEPIAAHELAADAATAEGVIGIHGVSVILRKTPAGPHGQAEMAAVQEHFGIIQTGKNRSHYTVALPKPVTLEVADRFHALFKWFK